MSFNEVIGRFCYARACTEKREQSYLMCNQHWAMVAPALQRRVIKAMGRYERDPEKPGHKTELRQAMQAARTCVEWRESHDRAQTGKAR